MGTSQSILVSEGKGVGLDKGERIMDESHFKHFGSLEKTHLCIDQDLLELSCGGIVHPSVLYVA
jgi:hypothetical protein